MYTPWPGTVTRWPGSDTGCWCWALSLLFLSSSLSSWGGAVQLGSVSCKHPHRKVLSCVLSTLDASKANQVEDKCKNNYLSNLFLQKTGLLSTSLDYFCIYMCVYYTYIHACLHVWVHLCVYACARMSICLWRMIAILSNYRLLHILRQGYSLELA